MNLTLNITADIGGHTVHCGQVNLSVPDELVMQLVPPPPAQPGPSVWASVEQAEPVVMVRDERPLIERSWMHSAQFQRYGKRVLDAITKMGRFQGTAAELVLRSGLEIDNRMVGQTLQAALQAEQLAGTMRREFQSKPYVYDVWVPGSGDVVESPAVESPPAEPVAPVREQARVPAVASVPMTESELRAAVVAGLPKGDDFDGTDEAFFWRVVGRAPVAGDLAAMRTVLEQMDQERRIDFREIAREGAPALWEVFA